MPALSKRFAFFFAFLLIAGTGAAQQTSEQEVLNLSKTKFDWLIKKQYDSLEKLLDGRVQYIHSNGWIQSKQEVLDDMKSGKLVYQNVTVKEAFARQYDNSTVITGLGRFEGINGGVSFSMDLRYTEVYIRVNGRWRLASRHSNRMP